MLAAGGIPSLTGQINDLCPAHRVLLCATYDKAKGGCCQGMGGLDHEILVNLPQQKKENRHL